MILLSKKPSFTQHTTQTSTKATGGLEQARGLECALLLHLGLAIRRGGNPSAQTPHLWLAVAKVSFPFSIRYGEARPSDVLHCFFFFWISLLICAQGPVSRSILAILSPIGLSRSKGDHPLQATTTQLCWPCWLRLRRPFTMASPWNDRVSRALPPFSLNSSIPILLAKCARSLRAWLVFSAAHFERFAFSFVGFLLLSSAVAIELEAMPIRHLCIGRQTLHLFPLYCCHLRILVNFSV